MHEGGVIPVHLIRRGPLSRNSGGPIRVITDLLDTCAATDAYERYGYVSVNDARMFGPHAATAIKAAQDTPLKQLTAQQLNASNIGLFVQLRRDAWRLRNRLTRTAFAGRIVHSHDQIASGLVFGGTAFEHILTIHSKGSVLNDVKLKVHPHIAGTWMQREFERLERAGVSAARVVTFPSAGARDLFDHDVPGALEGKDVRIVHNGVDMTEFAHPVPVRKPEEVFTILSVCAFVPEKRFDLTLDIAEALKQSGRRSRLVHIGEGQLRDAMHRETMKRELQDCVVLKGRMEHADVLAEQRRAHAFLLPAERTVFDIATLEAMAAGLPVVISDEGGNREMVSPGSYGDGFLCTPGDAAGFTDQLMALMDDEPLRFRTGSAARDTIRRRFTLQCVVEQFDSMYKELLHSRT